MARKQRRKSGDDASFEQEVYYAVRSLNWLLPESEDEIRASEAEFDEASVEVPARLDTPPSALERDDPPAPPSARRAAPELDPELQEAFARAAREGTGSIPPEVEDRMRRDRKEAEAEAEQRSNEQGSKD